MPCSVTQYLSNLWSKYVFILTPQWAKIHHLMPFLIEYNLWPPVPTSAYKDRMNAKGSEQNKKRILLVKTRNKTKIRVNQMHKGQNSGKNWEALHKGMISCFRLITWTLINIMIDVSFKNYDCSWGFWWWQVIFVAWCFIIGYCVMCLCKALWNAFFYEICQTNRLDLIIFLHIKNKIFK